MLGALRRQKGLKADCSATPRGTRGRRFHPRAARLGTVFALVVALGTCRERADAESWLAAPRIVTVVSVEAVRGEAAGISMSDVSRLVSEILETEANLAPKPIDVGDTCKLDVACQLALVRRSEAKLWVSVLLSPRSDGLEVFVDVYDVAAGTIATAAGGGAASLEKAAVAPTARTLLESDASSSALRGWLVETLEAFLRPRGVWGPRVVLTIDGAMDEAVLSVDPGQTARQAHGERVEIGGLLAGEATLRAEADDYKPISMPLTLMPATPNEVVLIWEPTEARDLRRTAFVVGAVTGGIGVVTLGVALVEAATRGPAKCIVWMARSCPSVFVGVAPGTDPTTAGRFSLVPIGLGLAMPAVVALLEAMWRGEPEMSILSLLIGAAAGVGVGVAAAVSQ